jgi:hypothetical protein
VLSPPRRLLVLAVLAATGCIQHRLDITLRTDVRADGSGTRRIEYRLERAQDVGEPAGRAGGDRRKDPPPGYRKDPASDPLRTFFRFPAGDPWSVTNEVPSDDQHTVLAWATFPSVNDLDWDYWRQRSPAGPAARNYISFSQTTSGTSSLYEYTETFRDPASPMAAARRLTQLMQTRDKAFADAFAHALGDEHRDRAPLRRAFREVLAGPLARLVEALAGRPSFGPHERRQLERLSEEGPVQDFTAALRALVLGTDPEAVDKAADAALTEVLEPIQKEMDAGGLPMALAFGEDPANLEIHFHATLVMPAAITRANTCFTGDTATWEFDQDDLYAGPLPMWAKAASP